MKANDVIPVQIMMAMKSVVSARNYIAVVIALSVDYAVNLLSVLSAGSSMPVLNALLVLTCLLKMSIWMFVITAVSSIVKAARMMIVVMIREEGTEDSSNHF